MDGWNCRNTLSLQEGVRRKQPSLPPLASTQRKVGGWMGVRVCTADTTDATAHSHNRSSSSLEQRQQQQQQQRALLVLQL